MDISSTVQFILGAWLGLGVLFATLLASTASIHATENWEHHHRVRATAFASFAGLSGLAALAGIVYAISLIAWTAPFAS